MFSQNWEKTQFKWKISVKKAAGEDRSSPKSPMGSLLHYVVVESDWLTDEWSVSVSDMLEMSSSLSSANAALPKKNAVPS